VKVYVDEIESPAGPLAFAVDEDGTLVRLHFVEGDYGPVMEAELEDEGYTVEADETRTAGVRRELAEYVSGRRRN
jgi:O6-methylguanine-DNA--protein-cysteine methyltransferase